MHVFVRGLDGRCRQVCVDACESVAGLKLVIQDVCGLPAAEQLLVHGGRVLDAQSSLQHTGLSQDDTVSLLLRLKGGKGGFGALLRGQGRDGKVTTNYDACRDLNGKRIRLVNAEKKQAEWQAKAGERLEEKAAVEQLKEMARQEKREKASQEHVAEVKAVQRQTVEEVQDAVQDALRALKPESAAPAGAPKRKGEGQKASPAKKPKMFVMLEELSSDSDSGSDSEESAETGAAAQ